MRNGNGHTATLPPPSAKQRRKLLDTLPPHDEENERSLLGSMILAGTENLDVIGEVMQIVRSPEDFYTPRHGVIYQVLTELYNDHAALDLALLPTALKDQKLYEQIGGVDYLIELAESVPTCINAPHYARTVAKKARLRRLQDAAGRILQKIDDNPADDEEIVQFAEQSVFNVMQDVVVTTEAVTMGQLMQEHLELMQSRSEGRTTGLPTGLFKLDELTLGLQPGELVIIAARPSMGKSALATTIAAHMAKVDKVPTVIFSLEMSKQMIADRLLAAESVVPMGKIHRMMMSAQDRSQVERAAADLSEIPLHIDVTSTLSLSQFRFKARRLVHRYGVRCIFLDYLQLMTCPGCESRQVEVATISRGLKAVARELNVPVVALSQLNRGNEDRANKRPMLSDLRESGAIEQDADVVMMLHREDYYKELSDEKYQPNHEAELIIAKQRNGATGIVKLVWVRDLSTFKSMYADPSLYHENY